MRVIVSALVRRGNQYLFIRQQKVGGAYPQTLHIPGGGLEPGEDPDAAIRRELKEEANIEVSNLRRYDFDWDITPYKGGTVEFIFLRYTADYLSGSASAGSDAAEVMWIDASELDKGPHNPPSIRLLKKLGLIDGE